MTIAQQLNITNFPFEIKDEKNRLIYREESNGFWRKWEYDENGKVIYREESNGYWWKREYDQGGNVIYTEDSDGYIADNRPKPEPEPEPEPKQETLEEVAENVFNDFKSKNPIVPQKHILPFKHGYIQGAKSEAARDYWFDQFKKKGGDK
jgi:hypothetical protein